MRHIFQTTCLITVILVEILAVHALCGGVWAASYTLKAPGAFSSIKLEQGDGYYGYSSFYGFNLRVEGWACSDEYANTTIYRIREMNRVIQSLLGGQESLAQLEKVFSRMKQEKTPLPTSQDMQSTIHRTISEHFKKAGFPSENELIERAESLAKDIFEDAKGGVNRMFRSWEGENMFRKEYHGEPGGIWKIFKMDQDDRSVVFVAQNCYQKNDLETMMNSMISVAKKLQESVSKYKDTKKRALETATRK